MRKLAGVSVFAGHSKSRAGAKLAIVQVGTRATPASGHKTLRYSVCARRRSATRRSRQYTRTGRVRLGLTLSLHLTMRPDSATSRVTRAMKRLLGRASTGALSTLHGSRLEILWSAKRRAPPSYRRLIQSTARGWINENFPWRARVAQVSAKQVTWRTRRCTTRAMRMAAGR